MVLSITLPASVSHFLAHTSCGDLIHPLHTHAHIFFTSTNSKGNDHPASLSTLGFFGFFCRGSTALCEASPLLIASICSAANLEHHAFDSLWIGFSNEPRTAHRLEHLLLTIFGRNRVSADVHELSTMNCKESLERAHLGMSQEGGSDHKGVKLTSG